MVPADGLVATSVTNEPTSGIAFWMVSLMPCDDHVTLAINEPIDPPEFAVSSSRTSLIATLTVMPLA
jgi:hypothetical protein